MDGEQNLAKAVIWQAIKDAGRHSDSYDTTSARNFLCAVNRLWEDSLKYWCDVAGIIPDHIIFSSRKKWRKDLL